MTDRGRVIVIGAGHNGLVCAAYLARAGRQVLVLEAATRVGGAAITREFAPGFKVSAGAHLLYALDPVITKELQLHAHGLSYARTNLRTVAIGAGTADGAGNLGALVLDGTQVVSGDVSAADRAALGEFKRQMHRFAAVLTRQHRRVPPRLAWEHWGEAMEAGALALDIRKLGRADMREFLRVATMNIFDVLEETFESPQLKAVLAMDGILGTQLGPRSGHTVLNMLHRLSGTMDGVQGSLCQPHGGMGSVTHAIAAAAQAAGAEIRLSSPVASVLLEGDRCVGVRLESGEQIAADAVVSNADPKTTFLALLGARHLETEFARSVDQLRAKGTAAKLHLALLGLPRFRGVDDGHLGERLLITGDLDYIDRAFNCSKYREYSQRPVLEITFPSIHDASLAPPGQHVLSAVVQYAPRDVAGGWNAMRDRFREVILDVLEEHAPGLRALVVSAELLTPLDLEQEFRTDGGHWHHGELTLDQFLMLRPVPGAAQYATPVRDLYLCSAGCHPGGGVMGSAGYNAARVVLQASRNP